MSDNGNTQPRGLVNRGIPARFGANTYIPIRTSAYGEQYTTPMNKWRHNAADEGTYFVAHNTTNDAATTLAGHAAPVLVDADATMTKPFIHARYNVSSTAVTRVYLDFIEIEVITAGATGSADSWAAQLDTGATRITSGGTALTKVNPNMTSAATSGLDLLAGAPVAGAETTSSRDLGFGQFRPSIQIAGDKFMFLFGGEPGEVGATSVATITHHVVGLPPVILGPTDQFLLALYSPSQNAAGVYKVRMGWLER